MLKFRKGKIDVKLESGYISVLVGRWAYDNWGKNKPRDCITCSGFENEMPKYKYVEYGDSLYLLREEPCYYA